MWVIEMKRITIPKGMSPELAEEIGIHIGDGSLLIRPDSGHYEYYICLSTEEREYMKHACELMQSLYSLKGHVREEQGSRSLLALFSSKQLALWKLSIGLPSGRKGQIDIPEYVLTSKFVLDCIRGIFDTDGSFTFKKSYKDVHYYPVIKLTVKSRVLISRIHGILSKSGFTTYTHFDEKVKSSTGTISIEHSLFVSGKESLELWMRKIGSQSLTHISKYLIWKEFGFCPPKTTPYIRKDILEGRIDPILFEDAGGEI